MLIEILKLLLPFLGGGLAGAILNEWLRRRSGRLQSISLIERANRAVNPELKGFTLARIVGDSDGRQLAEVRNLREYQLTLRNTTTIHLQDVEIQFEFPTEDVEEWVSRPKLSKTAPIPVEPTISDPWKRGFRWRVPHLPVGDSIEFSFRAVDPPNDQYEVALYKTDRVIIQRSSGEPVSKKDSLFAHSSLVVAVVITLGLFSLTLLIPNGSGGHDETLAEGGCVLSVSSSFVTLNVRSNATWPWTDLGPWRTHNSAVNIGSQKCTVQSEQLSSEQPVTIEAGKTVFRSFYSVSKPKLTPRVLVLGMNSPSRTVQAQFFVEQK